MNRYPEIGQSGLRIAVQANIMRAAIYPRWRKGATVMTHFEGEEKCSAWPIVGFEAEYRAGYYDPPHSHKRSQLLYAATGIMSVTVGRATFVIPPQRAIWVPANQIHHLSCRGPVSLRTLYFSDGANLPVKQAWETIEVSDFLRALIVEASHFNGNGYPSQREQLIADLLRLEIDAMPTAPFHAPMPTDFRLLRACDAVLADPSAQWSLEQLAQIAAMGRRTFTRRFKSETGIGAMMWWQQIRLMEALSMLQQGRSVSSVAFDIGYDSLSAFTAMFHRLLGKPPSHFRRRGAVDVVTMSSNGESIDTAPGDGIAAATGGH